MPASIPLVLSHLDKRANLRSHARPSTDEAQDAALPRRSSSTENGKGKAPATEGVAEGELASDAAAPAGEASDAADVDGDTEPLAFDLEPEVPAPPTTIPRSTARYELPDGVDSVDDCALIWIGGESLALNNLLLTHGRCHVRGVSSL